MSGRAEIVSVNVSEVKGTAKHSVDEIVLNERGVAGDAHAGTWHRQVTVLSQERLEAFSARTGRPVGAGDFAENLTIRGLDLRCVAPLDRLGIGEVELEVTQIGKKCHGAGCVIYREVGECLMPGEGIFCRVARGGAVRPGDAVEYRPRPLRFRIVTLSDRAFAGEYEDRSGPQVRRSVEEFFSGTRWHVEIEGVVLPDDAQKLDEEARAACDGGADVLITTGGTGVGPRDIAPETLAALCEKTIPGIMEHVRLKFGADKPTALLSRSVAGVRGRTQIYALPGSVRAVKEYMGEILKNIEHLLFMLHGIDVH